jgi:hypothetical protein
VSYVEAATRVAVGRQQEALADQSRPSAADSIPALSVDRVRAPLVRRTNPNLVGLDAKPRFLMG